MSQHQRLSRRQFLQLSALTLAGASATFAGVRNASLTNLTKENELLAQQRHLGQPLLVSGYRDRATQSRFGVMISNTLGQVVSDFSVPQRLHMADLFPAVHDSSQSSNDTGQSSAALSAAPLPADVQPPAVLANSREPGAALQKYDFYGRLLAEQLPPSNMHFEGHTVFSADGRKLYTTASDYVAQRGYVLELDSNTLAIERQFHSGGIGPHELVIQADQLLIANTGVLTHPDSGRSALNIDTMESNLAQLDIHSGNIVHRWRSPIPALSARHLDGLADGRVLVGCQYQKRDQRPACLALAQAGATELTLLDNNHEHYYWDMKGYTASVKAFAPGSALAGQALVSNPRGHLLSHWQANNTTLLNRQDMQYSKGIMVSGSDAWISAAAGELWHWDGQRHQLVPVTRQIKADFWWENHLYGRVI
jgi:hypothetical protein